jgi:hypothetical protein
MKSKSVWKDKKPPLQVFSSKELGEFTIEGVYQKQKGVIKAKTTFEGNELVDIKTCSGESCNGDCGCDEDCWYY